MDNEQQVYDALNALSITYEVFQHPPVFTVEDANKHWIDIPGKGCKNLFLRDNKGTKHYLLVVPDEKRVDIKAFGADLKLGRLGFGSPDRLIRFLGLTPGSVSPFGLINDPDGLVTVYIDECLLSEERVTFHPNINTATVMLSTEDFKKFLKSRKNAISFVHIPEMQD